MHFEGEFSINAPRERVWNYISDPHSTLDYVPLVKKLDVQTEHGFDISVGVAVGGINGILNFEVEIAENTPPSHAKIKAHGEGIRSVADVGIAIDLVDVPESKTGIVWTADAQVGGLVAGVGQRLLQTVTEKTIEELFEKLRDRLEA